MKRNLRFAVAALLAAVAWLPGGMQAQAPYVPQKTDFGGTAISDLNSFTPSSSDYTLQVEGTAGTPIVVNGGSYTYTPTTSGTVRFVYYKGNLYVYEGSTYMKTLTSGTATVVYPSITSSTVTTSTDELLSNPGFETVGTTITTDKYNFGVPWTTNVTCAAFGIRVGVKNSEKVVVWRGSGNSNYFTQSLTSIKANTNYKVQMEQVDGGNATATFNVGLGSTAGGIEYASSTVKLGNGLNGEKTATFKTPSTIASTVYFSFKNTSTNTASAGNDPVTQLSYISLVEGSIPISGVNSATYLEGTAYAPESTLESGKYLDATNQITNPSFEISNFSGWTNTNSMSQTNSSNLIGKDGTYFVEKWVNHGSQLPDCGVSQTISGIPAGYYYLSMLGQCIQQSTNVAATGGVLFAGSDETTVGFLNTYTVATQVTGTSLDLGFKTTSTTGNWAAIDNFKLYYGGATLAEFYSYLDGRKTALNTSAMGSDEKKAQTDADAAWTTLGSNLTGKTASDLKTAFDARETAIANTSSSATNYAVLNEAITYVTALKNTIVAQKSTQDVSALETAIETATTAYNAGNSTDPVADALALRTNTVTSYLTGTGPVLTTFISNPETSGATGNALPTGWTCPEKGNTYTTSGQFPSDAGKVYLDSWAASGLKFTVNQIIYLPAGTYVLASEARTGGAGFYLYSDDGTTKYQSEVTKDGNVNGTMTGGWNKNYLVFTTTAKGQVTIGISTNPTYSGGANAFSGQWASATNFALYDLGSYDIAYNETEDNTNYLNAVSAANVTLTRTFKSSNWNTLCLPFSMTADQVTSAFGSGTSLATLNSVTGSTLSFVTATAITANVPCLIKPTTTTSPWTINGVAIVSGTPAATQGDVAFTGLYAPVTNLYLSKNATNHTLYIISSDKFYEVDASSKVALKGFRAYVDVNGASSVKAFDVTVDGQPTAVEGININEPAVSGNIYNLNGQMVRKNASTMEGLQKGVYIVNGKKQIVK